MKDKLKEYCDLTYKMRNSNEKEIKKELQDILANLRQEMIKKFSNESDIKTFLDNIPYMNNYSYNNQVLINAQMPRAKYVTSFLNIKKMGYRVNNGEEGIKILVPSFLRLVKCNFNNKEEIKFLNQLSKEELKKYKDPKDNDILFYKDALTHFKVGTVFDLTQTNMPTQKIESTLNPVLEHDSENEIIDIFIKAIYKNGYKVEYEKIKDGAKGYCNLEKKIIVLKKDLGDLMKLKVIIHEYAHALVHNHLKNDNLEYQKNRYKYETEAEGIAYSVCKFLGLDTGDYSLNYLYSWSKEKNYKELDNSLETIVKESSKIINNFQAMYQKEFSLYEKEKFKTKI